MTFDEVSRLASTLPGVEEGSSYGTPALRVRKLLLARLREDGETMVLRCEPIERDALMQAEAGTFFTTDHYRGYPCVLVRLSRVRPSQMRELLEGAWRRRASRRMLADHESRQGVP